ncbi:MAG: hypothetical protein J0I65_26710 [Variovorax sp.]|uniref:Uncharacterized protein n=1 Tax=Variovorax paradoxus TaxID=34073 RepID=A0A2W5QEZ5_VARPD|nr:hypothetical protein [Variovorax sp.]PZQ77071.1 MAG: hypothetical protein DI563_05055 [Variovorax paradoxus]
MAAMLFLASLTVDAAPGAHGPNGEHLDAPTSAGRTASAAPSFETRSELFEMVGRLQGGELSMLIHRYETNEPVLQAEVEIESGTLSAKAPFHSDFGDYAIADDAMLKLLASPGEHALVITVKAGDDVDLLDGVLKVPEAAHSHDGEHGHGHGIPRSAWVIAGFLALIAAGALWSRRSRRTQSAATEGAMQ